MMRDRHSSLHDPFIQSYPNTNTPAPLKVVSWREYSSMISSLLPYSGLLVIRYRLYDDYSDQMQVIQATLKGCDSDAVNDFEELKKNPCKFIRQRLNKEQETFIFMDAILFLKDEKGYVTMKE